MRNHILVGLDNVSQKGSGCHREVELIVRWESSCMRAFSSGFPSFCSFIFLVTDTVILIGNASGSASQTGAHPSMTSAI